MEITNYLKEKLKDKRGSIFFIFIGLLFILMTIFMVVMEYFYINNVYNEVITELERASNIAVEYSMTDEARGYHISTINSNEAQAQFDKSFKTKLGLNGSLEKFVSNGNGTRRLYKINFTNFEIDEGIPQIIMKGTVSIDLQLVGQYMVAPVNLPFYIKTKNIN